MLGLLIAFSVSLGLTLLIVRSARWDRHFLLDHDTSGPQKFHAAPVPRIGGVGIVFGLVAAFAAWGWFDRALATTALTLLACGAPAFVTGVVEDLTKRVRPAVRLAATAVSALLAIQALEATITRTAIPGLDWVAATALGAVLLTVFAVSGIANAVNIIDGFNGLASMCVVIMLCGLAVVAQQADDPLVAQLALAGVAAVIGFFVLNFPAGRLFLGDGGAYFLGFYVAELSILLLVRNPGKVSPLCPLLMVIYPVFETIFSIYRRRLLRAVPSSRPDGIHLHSLIYRRVVRPTSEANDAKALTRRNSRTSPYLWMLCMLSVVPAVFFWRQTAALVACLVLFGMAYVALYWRIVRFRSPRWLVFGPQRARIVHEADNRPT